jgi:hypothetical protein
MQDRFRGAVERTIAWALCVYSEDPAARCQVGTLTKTCNKKSTQERPLPEMVEEKGAFLAPNTYLGLARTVYTHRI